MHKNPYDYHATPTIILVPAYLLLGAAAVYVLKMGLWPLVVAVAVIGVGLTLWRKKQHHELLRGTVLELLETYASAEEQVRIEKASPLLSVPADLQGSWEDLYHPELDWFRAAYSHEKLVRLEAFNATFRENALKLKPQVKSIKVWQKDKRWKAVMAAAGVTVKKLG